MRSNAKQPARAIRHSFSRRNGRFRTVLLQTVLLLGVLWLNGNANGHSIFLLLPQLLTRALFGYLVAVLTANL